MLVGPFRITNLAIGFALARSVWCDKGQPGHPPCVPSLEVAETWERLTLSWALTLAGSLRLAR
jgi:hypothetical protein